MHGILWGLVIAVVVLGLLRLFGNAARPGPGAVADKLKQGARVLDVRTAEEFAGGHYAGAINIPVQDLERRAGELGARTQPIVVYCRSGNRSATAVQILRQAGFTDLTNAGGLGNMPR